MPARPTLVGRRLRLEPLGPEHLDGLLAAAGESRASYLFTTVPEDPASMSVYIDVALDDQARGLSLPFAVRRLDGVVVGSTRFLDLVYWDPPLGAGPGGDDPRPSGAEIGNTWLAASAQRSGINQEMKLLMLAHAFERWAVHRVSFKTDARNKLSRRAIEGLGARYEGIRRAHMPAVDGTVRDSAYYSILRTEWPAVRALLEHRLLPA